MSLLYLEFTKIINRRFSLVLLISTIILFPAIVKIISHLSITADKMPEGFFADNVAFATIAYSQTYFFIPVWIIIFVGQELSNGHVNRVIFLKSRKYFFLSKIAYCALVTLLFTVLGFISVLISIGTAPISNLDIPLIFYLQYLVQAVLANFLFVLFLLSIVFLLKSPLISFVVYFGLTFVEGIFFTLIKGIYKVELTWLPLHLVRTLYTRNGEVNLENYYNPIATNPSHLVLPLTFVTLLVGMVYYFFLKSNLKPLSD